MNGNLPPAPLDRTKLLFRRIIDFPLVAMVLSLLVIDLGLQAGAHVSASMSSKDEALTQQVSVASAIVLAFVLYKLVVRHLGERPRDDLPFSIRAARDLAAGTLLGAFVITLSVAVAAALLIYRFAGFGDHTNLMNGLIGLAIVPAFTEELLFRGILLRWLEPFVGTWAALTLTSALFGIVHLGNPNATGFSAASIALEAGILLGALYVLTRSLWASIGCHAGWNFAQGFLFDAPVSGIGQHGLVKATLSGPVLLTGGGFGLEASLITVTIGTTAGLLAVRLAVVRGHIVAPWWAGRFGRAPLAHDSGSQANRAPDP